MASLIVVGVPASLLKAIICFGFLPAGKIKRGELFLYSVCTGATAGLAAIVTYFGLSEFSSLFIFNLVTVPEVAAAAALIGLTAFLDMKVWQTCRLSTSDTGIRWRRILWLVAGNLWIAWAMHILLGFSTGQFSSACDSVAFIASIQADESACELAPRQYWSAHPDLFEEALRLSEEND